jgi:hypothetical protein
VGDIGLARIAELAFVGVAAEVIRFLYAPDVGRLEVAGKVAGEFSESIHGGESPRRGKKAGKPA